MKNILKNGHLNQKINHIFKILFSCFALLFSLIELLFFHGIVRTKQNINFNLTVIAENSESSKRRYAKAKENCYLFKTSDVSSLNVSNVYFLIPETYFVTILFEMNSSVYKVEYKGKIGYVSTDTIVVATFVPIVSTLDDVFVDISSSVGTQLRSSPFAENLSNVIVNIAPGTKNLEYVSFIESTKPIGGNSKIWYYVLYYPENDPTAYYEGYVYSEKTTNLTSFSDNLENNPEIKNEKSEPHVSGENNFKIVLLVLILLPAVLVFVIVAFRSRKMINSKQQVSDNDSEPKENKNLKRSVNSLKGKHFVQKQNNDDNETEFETEVSGISPRFPTYDIADDDDLLWCLNMV